MNVGNKIDLCDHRKIYEAKIIIEDQEIDVFYYANSPVTGIDCQGITQFVPYYFATSSYVSRTKA